MNGEQLKHEPQPVTSVLPWSRHYYKKSIGQKPLTRQTAGTIFSLNLSAHYGVLMLAHFAHQSWYCTTQSLNTVVQYGRDPAVNSQLKNTMHTISGCVWSTQIPWFPVLANIALLSLCRKAATDNLRNIQTGHCMPMY